MRLRKNPVPEPFHRLHVLRSCQEARAPLRKDGRNLVLIFLGDEIVETSLRLEQRGFDGQLAAIVRMQMEFAGRTAAF